MVGLREPAKYTGSDPENLDCTQDDLGHHMGVISTCSRTD